VSEAQAQPTGARPCPALSGEPLPELALGAREVVDALEERIKNHFARLDRAQANGREHEEPLVIGLFGEWGSGKTLWLKSLEERFRERLINELSGDEPPDSITLPVFFNAWRYEKEEHLIYPLVRVLERQITALYNCAIKESEGPDKEQKKAGRIQNFAKTIMGLSRRLLAAAGAGVLGLGAGVKITGEISVGSGLLSTIANTNGKVKIEISGRDIADFLANALDDAHGEPGTDSARTEGDGASSKPRSEVAFENLAEMSARARSDYYDFQRILRELTGRDGSNPNRPALNLLFFVDDLDRCLPEKAVEMLEAIKLFLEVEGTAFVLALDDEVVGRGIAHRYRDYARDSRPAAEDGIAYSLDPERYREFLGLYADHREEPVTGHEYLEKIVHLQVRVPRPGEADARKFLQRKYPELFGGGQEYDLPRQGSSEAGEAGEARDRKAGPPGGQRLLDLFTTAVPLVPRKLIRAAELLGLKLKVARNNGWDLAKDEDELYILAQLTIIQLFAPELYSFALKKPFFILLLRLEELLENTGDYRIPPPDHCLEELARAYRGLLTGTQDQGKDGEAESADEAASHGCAQQPVPRLNRPYLIEQLELPFLDLLIRSRRQRSGFDPFNVVAGNKAGLYEKVEPARFFTLRPSLPRTGSETRQAADGASLPPLVPKDILAFIEQITAPEPSYWQNALADPGLSGREGRLAESIFEELKERAPKFDDPDLLIDWLETVSQVLSPEQLDELVAQSKVFEAVFTGGENGQGRK